MNKSEVLLTTSSDDSLWDLSEITIPRILRLLDWKHDHMHFHDGKRCEKIYPNYVQIKSYEHAYTNRVYRTIVEYIKQSDKYSRWLHFDGDMFMGGSDPKEFIDRVIRIDKPGTRLQQGGTMNIRKDGTLEFHQYDIITSQQKYIDVKDAIQKVEEFIIKKNVPWTIENAFKIDFSVYPYKTNPLQMINLHTHLPHDGASGKQRRDALEKFLTYYYQYTDYKFKDSARFPWALPKYTSMLQFRTKLVGQLYATVDDLLIRDSFKDRFIIQFEDGCCGKDNGIDYKY